MDLVKRHRGEAKRDGGRRESIRVAATPMKPEAELQLHRALDRLLAELVNHYMQGRGEKKT